MIVKIPFFLLSLRINHSFFSSLSWRYLVSTQVLALGIDQEKGHIAQLGLNCWHKIASLNRKADPAPNAEQ